MYTDLVNRLEKDWNEKQASSDRLLGVKGYIQRQNGVIKNTYNVHCETGKYTLKVPLLDLIVVDLLSLEVMTCSTAPRLSNSMFISKVPIVVHFKDGVNYLMKRWQ